MTNFTDFSLVFDNLVEYFTGSYSILAISIVVLFMIVLLASGLDFRYTSLFALPLLSFFVLIGWFGVGGASTWIINIGLIVVSVFYAFAVIRMTS